VDIPAELERYVVWKGSITLDGISLTVARLDGLRVGVAIIPHTYENTNLLTLAPGDALNVECDVLAKYVEKLVSRMNLERAGNQELDKSTIPLSRFLEEGF
jgi:riboflavin synthase